MSFSSMGNGIGNGIGNSTVNSDSTVRRMVDRALQQYHFGDYAGGVESLREALSVHPELAELHSHLAVGLLRLKRLHAACHEAELGLRLGPESDYCHYVTGSVYHARQRYPQAIACFERAMALAPHIAEYPIAVALSYRLKGERRQAEICLEQAREIDPENADVFAEFGDWHRENRDYTQAETCYRQALALEPQHRDALLGVGHLRLLRGDTGQAREHAIWVLQQDANHLGALHLLAGVKARTNPLTGCWWRLNAWLSSGSSSRTILLLVLGYVAFRTVALILSDQGYTTGSKLVSYAWIGIVIYSWVGPAWFRQSFEKELKTVTLKPEF